jgi:hypothetical protein
MAVFPSVLALYQPVSNKSLTTMSNGRYFIGCYFESFQKGRLLEYYPPPKAKLQHKELADETATSSAFAIPVSSRCIDVHFTRSLFG